MIYKDNYLNGSGVKTFYEICNLYKLKERENKINLLENLGRNNKITCSTHPHNTYFQILSEIGVFGFIMVFFLFLKTLFKNVKIIFKKILIRIILAFIF